MKKQMLYIILIVISLIFSVSTSNAVTISFDQLNPFDSVGDLVEVDLVISGLGTSGPPSVGAFDLDITYETSKLRSLWQEET